MRVGLLGLPGEEQPVRVVERGGVRIGCLEPDQDGFPGWDPTATWRPASGEFRGESDQGAAIQQLASGVRRTRSDE